MSTDILARLARLERETGVSYDPRWDLLAQGALPRDDAEALRAAAHRRGAERVHQAFLPFDAAACERLARHALSIVDTAGRAGGPASAAGRRRPGRMALAGATAAAFFAAAITISFIVRLRLEPPPVATSGGAAAPAAAPLPPYRLEVSGGDTPGAVRSAPSGGADAPSPPPPSLLGPGASLGLVVRPSVPAGQPVSLRACAFREGPSVPRDVGPSVPRDVGPSVPRDWPVSWERSEQGAFRVEGTRESLFPGEPPGQVTLLLAVGPGGDPPSCATLPSAGLPVLTHRVVLR